MYPSSPIRTLPPNIRLDEEQTVGLGHILKIKAHGAVVADLAARSTGLVHREPANQMRVLTPVETLPHRGWHVNDSFNELGLLEMRHRLVTPLELGDRQAIAVLKRRDLEVS